MLLAVLDPVHWFQGSIPALTDLPGHVLPPSLLRSELLPAGDLQGWTFEWFAGFPVYRFYFVLPGLAAAGLGALLGDGLAIRIVAAAPIVLLPWALWAFGRLAGLSRSLTAGITVVGSSCVLMTSHRIMGGNILSVVAGEFSYAWSLPFVALYLGILVGPGRSGLRTFWAGAALAAALLCHVVPVIVAVLGTSVFLFSPALRTRVLGSWLVSGILAGFWFVPMALRLGYVASWKWAYVPSLTDVVPAELFLVVPAALYGVWVLRRHPGIHVLGAVAVAALALTVVPQDLVMRARTLPVWFLAVHALAGAGMAQAILTTVRHTPRRAGLGLLVALPLTGLWLFILLIRGVDSSNWRPVMEGLPATPAHRELAGLVERLETLPEGRIHWEPGEWLQEVGGAHAMALIPYWTHHTSLGGLLVDSAPLSQLFPVVDSELSREETPITHPRDVPSVPWSPAQALARLRTLGVRYLVTHSEETSTAVAEAAGPPLDRFGPLRLFDLGPVGLVEAIRCWEPLPPGTGFRKASLDWFIRWSPGAPTLAPVDALPATAAGSPSCAWPEDRPAPEVDGVRIGEGEIRFAVQEAGVPILLRVSYFPAWRAEGARGPFPAGPRFMAVVPEERVVTLRYGPDPMERAGWFLTLGGSLLLVVVAGSPWARRRLGWGSEDSVASDGVPTPEPGGPSS